MSGWILPEEEVDRVLAGGLDDVRTAVQAGTLDVFLARVLFNVPPKKRAEFRNLLKTTLPEIVHGWPHEQQTLPCWAIIIKGGQNTQYVGDGTTQYVDPDTGALVDASVVRWDNRIGILSLSENGDTCRYLNQLAKFLLDRAKQSLTAAFLEQNLSEEDLGPPQQYSGRIVWARQTILSVAFHQTDGNQDIVGPFTPELDLEAHDPLN